MATAEELLNSISKNQVSVLSEDDGIFVIDGESRTITVPDSERLFGVEGDKDVERKYFQSPKIVGDNIDLSQHQIYVSYVFTTTENNTVFPTIGNGLYHCDDVEVSGDNITFSWLLSGNVFANPGFIAFKVMAKKSEGGELKTKWNTAPAIGTVLLTVPDGEEIAEEYPDIINQLLTKMESVEQIATPEAMQGYVDTYLKENPVTGGMTEEQEQQLNQNTADVTNLKNDLNGKVSTNQGKDNAGKTMVVGEDGQLTPEDVKIPVDNTLSNAGQAADAKATGEALKRKLGEDLVTQISSPPTSELLKQNITDTSGWINIENYVNLVFILTQPATGGSSNRLYYASSDPGSDDVTSYLFWSVIPMEPERFTITDANVLSAKYVNLSVRNGATIDIYGIKKSESGKMELYTKGDSIGDSSEKTVELNSLFNGDDKLLECIPGETYTLEYESFNGAIQIGVYANDTFVIYQRITSLTNGMTINIPDNANYLRFSMWGVYTVKVTGKFYGDLTRPSQKLVEENFTEDILKYIRSNIGGNVSGAVFYNCQDYGVIPGSSDNTDAMQSLIDLAHENGGGVIWIPVGTYKFHKDGSTSAMGGNAQNNVYLKSNVSILGESVIGSVFKLYGDTQTGCSMFGFFTSGEDVLEGCTFSNFTVDLSEETMAQYSHKGKAFYVSGIKNCIFRDLRLISTPSTSLGIDMLDNVVMDSIYVYQGGRQWALGGNGGAGIGIGTGKWKNENYVIRNCVCDSCGHFGIFLEDQGIFSSAKDKNYPKGQIIANNVVRNGRHYALGLRGGKNVIFTGNNTYENVGGMYLDYGAQNVIIANNIFADCTENGLLFGNEDNTVNGTPESIPCDTVFVSGNLFKNNKVAIKELTVPISMEKSNNMFIGNTSES